MPTTLFSTLTESDKNDSIKRLIEDSTPHDDFFLMTVLAVLMAALGLLIDDVAVIIGSMLIAPMLSPILGLSLGVVMADSKLIFRSFWTVVKSLAWAIPIAAIATLIFSSQAELGVELNNSILSRTEPSIINIAIAVVAGAAVVVMDGSLVVVVPGAAVSELPPQAEATRTSVITTASVLIT